MAQSGVEHVIDVAAIAIEEPEFKWKYDSGKAVDVTHFTFTFTGPDICSTFFVGSCSGEVWQSCLLGVCVVTKAILKDRMGHQIRYPHEYY